MLFVHYRNGIGYWELNGVKKYLVINRCMICDWGFDFNHRKEIRVKGQILERFY